jgi:hypothetical protein
MDHQQIQHRQIYHDTIVMKVSEPHKEDSKVKTKRTVLLIIAKLFNPLGLYSPFTLTAKLLFQKLWEDSKTWDKQVTKAILKD